MKRFIILIGLIMCAGLHAKSFLNPPEIIEAGSEDYQDDDLRRFQGISSLAVSKSGRIWATWYGGPTAGEDENNYVIVATSGDDGESWEEKFILDPDGPGDVRAFDPELWIDTRGSLWLFWAQHPASDKLNPHSGVWAMRNDTPDSADGNWSPSTFTVVFTVEAVDFFANKINGNWSEPRRLTEGIMMCKPTVLSDGTWLLPASTWRDTDYSARAVASDNKGLSFEVVGACNILPEDQRAPDEHMFVELNDGTIWMLVRTGYGIGESFSTDKGATWSELTPSSIEHTPSRFFIRRLNSGNLLLVKHGPIDEQTGRSDLMAFISEDDGNSWQGGLMLDERNGVSYPDGQQTDDGTIYITYDYNRTGEKMIYMTTFTEADVLASADVSGKVRKRVVISAGAPPEPDDNQDGVTLVKTPAASVSGGEGVEGVFVFEEGAKIFANRSYEAVEIPEALEGTKFVQANLGGDKTLTCNTSGMMGFLTPKPSRHHDSQTLTLLSQGFEKVALPETPSFNYNTKDYCTLYQKYCEQGEVITYGQWAIPIIFE